MRKNKLQFSQILFFYNKFGTGQEDKIEKQSTVNGPNLLIAKHG